MSQNQNVTLYDDAGYPTSAAFALPVTIITSLTGLAIKTGPGRLIRVIVNTALVGASGSLVFYDNASTASGTPLLTIPVANGTAGAVITADVPAKAGIYMANPSGTLTAGQVTIAYS